MKNKIQPNKVERFILKITPPPVKKFINWLLSLLPNRLENWVRKNSFLSICIVYAIRGAFFRPIMWPIYASIAAYFSFK
jgi:hypothetical protein